MYTVIQKVFIRNVPWRFYAKSKFCICFEVHIPVEKQLLNFKNASVSHCFTNSSPTIIWNNLGLSNYNCMKRKLRLKKTTTKKAPVIISERNYFVPYSQESPLTLMHLRHLSTIPSFWVEYFAERLLKGVSSNMCFFSKSKTPFHTFVIRQTRRKLFQNDSQ